MLTSRVHVPFPNTAGALIRLHSTFGRDLCLQLLRFIQVRPIVVGLGHNRRDYAGAVGGRKPEPRKQAR